MNIDSSSPPASTEERARFAFDRFFSDEAPPETPFDPRRRPRRPPGRPVSWIQTSKVS